MEKVERVKEATVRKEARDGHPQVNTSPERVEKAKEEK